MAKGSEYRKSETNGVTTFEVTPAAAPKSGCAVMLGVFILGGGLLSLFKMGSLGGGLFFLAIFGGIGFLILRTGLSDQRPKEHQNATSFRVGPDYIEIKGQVFKSSDIHRLILRNAITKNELAGLEAQLATNAAAGCGMAIGNSIRAQIVPIANALTLESGGKSTFLAGGMDETTAYGLLQDVSRILESKGPGSE